LTGFFKNPENGRKEPRADAVCSPGAKGAHQAGNLGATAGGSAGHQAAAQRQGTDRPVSLPPGPKSQPQHRSRAKRLALQRRVRGRRRRDRVGDAGRGHQLHARGGTAEAELSAFRDQRSRTAAKNLDRAETAAVVPGERGRSKTAGHRGGLLPPDAEADAGSATVPHPARPEIFGRWSSTSSWAFPIAR
jgi:hypothetical protein